MSKIVIDPSQLQVTSFEGLRKSLLEESRNDSAARNEYIKTRTKVASSIRKDRLMEENPEIALELKRRQELKEASKKARQDKLDKINARRLETKNLRQQRIQAEADAKKLKEDTAKKLYADAGISEETIARIIKASTFERRDNENKITSVKCLVSFKTKDGKYDRAEAFVDFTESEEVTLAISRDKLIALLIEIDNS